MTESLAKPVKKKRRKRSFLVTYIRIIIVVAVAMGAVLAYFLFVPRRPEVHHLTGYISDAATLETEYARFQGKPLRAMEIEQQFEAAAKAVQQGEYYQAADLLQVTVRQAPLPVIFNDLGVLYAQLNDRARAVNAFREALARDAGYIPVRQNMDRLKGFTSNMADPVSTEIEPNNSVLSANLIAVDRPVEGEIVEDMADEDYFRFTVPPAPRDRLEISILNRSQTLAPRLRMYDEEGIILPMDKDPRQPGESLNLILAPPPNTTFYLNVSADKGSFGAYTLTIKTLKSFDAYEPNDDIYSARKIVTGQEIEANIMDAADTDFYSFVAPRTGTVSIDIQNRSSTLVPALSTFTPDMRTSGFGPDVDRSGGSLHHSIPVREGETYYLQVWSQAKTSGEYSLKVQ